MHDRGVLIERYATCEMTSTTSGSIAHDGARPAAPASGGRPPGAAGRANRHALADAALNSASDEAGTFDYPGRYIHVKNCAFRLWVFSFSGLRSKQPIALSMLESKDALAILVGGAANVFGFRSEKPIDGWIPSDPGGLHYLARFASESDFDSKTVALFRLKAE